MSINKQASQPALSIRVSKDGYIRLTEKTLHAIPIRHLDSGVYRTDHRDHPATRPSTLSGYTEWVSETSPAISIGWDWQLLHEKSPFR